MTTKRNTWQREAVRTALTGSEGFVIAQSLHSSLRDEGSPIGLATVYRALNDLATEGEAAVALARKANAVGGHRLDCGWGCRRQSGHDCRVGNPARHRQRVLGMRGRAVAGCQGGGDPAAGGTVGVRLGAIDGDPGIRPRWRQWVESAPEWEPIPDDGLPRFARRRELDV